MRWYGYPRRLSEDRLVKHIYRTRMDGTKRGVRLLNRWLDGLRKVLSEECANVLRRKVLSMHKSILC